MYKPSDFTHWTYWIRYEWREWNPYELSCKIYRFARTVWAFRDALWEDQNCDWTFLLRYMQIKLARMGKHFDECGILVNSDRTARECRTAAALCQRLIDDNYLQGEITRRSVIKEGERRKADLDYLARLMSRKLFCWWD